MASKRDAQGLPEMGGVAKGDDRAVHTFKITKDSKVLMSQRCADKHCYQDLL